MELSTAKLMLKGSADSLNSAFNLSYNMLLNQMRSEDGDPEKLLRNSFYQFQCDRALPDLEKQLKELKDQRDSMVIEEEESLKDYYNLLQQYQSLKNDVRDIVFLPKYCLPFLKPGRLARIRLLVDDTMPSCSGAEQVTWGVILNFERIKDSAEDRRPEDANYTVDVLARCVVNEGGGMKKSMKIVPLTEHGEPVVVSLSLSQIDSLSCACLHIEKDLLPLEARENTLKNASQVLLRFAKDGMPLLDPEEDMKVQSKSYQKAVRRIEALENLFDRHEIRNSPFIEQKLKVLHAKQDLTARMKLIKKTMHCSTALAFKDELKARKRVLRRLGYITSEDVVELKGKVACEISTADELIVTELMFSGILKDVNLEEMVALLSCFVWQEKLQDAPKPREALDHLYSQVQEIARRIANVQLDCKIQIDVENFVNSFRPDIMEAVYSWAKGSKFYDIVEIARVFEGSLIRAIRRLEELLQQLLFASKSIGEIELESKFEQAVEKIKRDIVFAASLYL